MNSKHWLNKIDPYGRRQLEEGLPASGLEVTVRLAREGAARIPELDRAGLEVHFTLDDVVVGRVADQAALARLAGLPFVKEVQVSQTLQDETHRSPP
jgi:hypothetical protein